MTDDKVREVLDRYETRIVQAVLPKLLTPEAARTLHDPQLSHLLTMIPKMRNMLDMVQLVEYHQPDYAGIRAQREKLMRWLGFMQGVLHAKGIYSIDEMRAHNAPDGEALRERD